MRIVLLIPLLMIAAPAAAQAPRQQPTVQIQRVLSDPAMADRMANVMQSLSNAMLELPIGEIEAAVEGRTPTAADKRRRMRDVEPDLQSRVAQARPMIRQSMKALSEALPAMLQSLEQAQRSLERAAANMPDPTYPKR